VSYLSVAPKPGIVTFEPADVETVTFDSYSTIVDVDAAERALADRVTSPERHERPRESSFPGLPAESDRDV